MVNFKLLSDFINKCPSKLFQRILSSRITSHLVTNSSFFNCRYSFRKGLSCDTQLAELSVMNYPINQIKYTELSCQIYCIIILVLLQCHNLKDSFGLTSLVIFVKASLFCLLHRLFYNSHSPWGLFLTCPDKVSACLNNSHCTK